MRIAFASPAILCDKFRKLVESEFPRAEVKYLIYQKFEEEVPDLLRHQERFDGILFGSRAAMAFADSRVPRKTFWIQLPRNGYTLLCALLSSIRSGWDITRLSFDGDINSPAYTENVFRFHEENLRTRKAAGCITELYRVDAGLKKFMLPSILMLPTRNNIREQLDFIQQFYRAQETAKRWLDRK